MIYYLAGPLYYTDDTAMLKSVAESLIYNKGFNAAEMAKRYIVKLRENSMVPNKKTQSARTSMFFRCPVIYYSQQSLSKNRSWV